jgi:hypothetical protein
MGLTTIDTHSTSLYSAKKALRIVSKSRWNAHTTPLFRNLSTLKLVDINKLQTGIFMHRAVNHQLPSLFTSYFISNTNIHNYFTRQCHNLHYPGLRTNLRKYSIKFFGSYLWNSLPIHLKTIIPTASFKKHINSIFYLIILNSIDMSCFMFVNS